MNIQPVSAPQMRPAASMASPIAGGRHDNQYHSALQSVAQLLGSSVSDIKAATATQNLTGIAAGKGVSQQALEASIKAGLQTAGTQLSGNRLDNIAHRVAGSGPRRDTSSISSAASTASSWWGAQS
jgi:mevalonate pyrophosphate decarboxylase